MSRPTNKGWMSEKNKLGLVHTKGDEDFIDFAIANNVQWLSTFPYPCVKCRTVTELRKHLLRHGMDQSYTTWVLHGENPPRNSIEHPPITHVEEKDIEEENIENEGIRMDNLVDAFWVIHENIIVDAEGSEIEVSKEACVSKEKYDEYKRIATEKLYPSCDGLETTLSAIVELYDIKKQFGWSGNGVMTLFSILKRWLLKGNTLPEKYPKMKSMMKDLGLKENFIHACVNNCVLFWMENENMEECPQCGEPRYVVTTRKGRKICKEPKKELRHFPLIPRLVRLYTIPWIAHEMTWHSRATSSWDYQRHPSDSAQWRMFKMKWPDFAKEERNVSLAIETDGFNSRCIQSGSYSCWPVIIVPYNLPPSS